MTNKKHTYSNIISLILHILIVWAAISLRSAHIITPSRSDGIEVSLIAANDIPQPEKPHVITTPPTPNPIQTLNTTADVNIKQESTPLPKVAPKAIKQKPVVVTPPITIPPAIKPEPKLKYKTKPNAQITNTLLDQLDATTVSGKSKGKTTGGTNSGTSNSNNMLNNYADLVISTVRPYVNIPEAINSNAKAVVKVVLLPSMQVYQVKLIKSSGNTEYDNNVQQAIQNVKVFPPLPEDANWTDYRILYLTFTPE